MWELLGELATTGIPGKVRFEDGVLSGDREILAAAAAYCARQRYVGLTPVGPYLLADMTDEAAAFVLVSNLVRNPELLAGAQPPLPAGNAPRGAIQ